MGPGVISITFPSDTKAVLEKRVRIDLLLQVQAENRPLSDKAAARRPHVYLRHSYGPPTFEHLEPRYVCFPDSPAALHEEIRRALAAQRNVTTGVVYDAA